MAKLDIGNEMAKLDQKDRAFYDSLDDEEKKKFSSYIMIRWASCVSGDFDLQAYYLQMTNKRLNKNFFSVKRDPHDKLNWLATTTVSPGAGNMRHNWISAPKKPVSNSKIAKFLSELYPAMKYDDIALMEQLNDIKSCKKLAEEMGWTKEQIKKSLG